MASLKEVKTRINSVKNTRKITSAMKMVASAKLHKGQIAIESMLPYQEKLNRILGNFLSADLPVESPFVQKRGLKRIAIVVFSSSFSLCGAFNANVMKMLIQTLGEFRTLGEENILLFPVGKKVEDAIKRMGLQPKKSFPVLSDRSTYQEAAALAHHLMEMYAAGEIDRVELIYHHFQSMGTQVLLRETFLPLDLTHSVKEDNGEDAKGGMLNDYIVEPFVEQLIADLIPTVLSQKIFTSAVDSSVSEHAARTLAMQVATDNANDLLQDLTKQYNKTRQQDDYQ